MKNWSGNVVWNPSEIAKPSSEQEVIALVQKAKQQHKKIRMIGSGHSFVPLSSTDDILLSLDNYQGLVSVNKGAQQATVRAGTKLHDLMRLLDKEGLALENMGDIDVQSIAGAVSTGTHGTGISFGNLSTQVTQLRFINGLGEVITCSEMENRELFKAAQVSLGVLGVLMEITIQCIPSYNLKINIDRNTVEHVIDHYEEYNQRNRHFEFYWFPNTPHVMTKELQMTQEPSEKTSRKEYLQDIVLENYGFGTICNISHLFPATNRRMANFAGSLVSKYTKTKKSFDVFSTARIVRFNEMEYNVPVEAYDEVFKEIINWNKRHNKTIMFPLEHRFVKGDDIYLSPAYKRDSAYIAVHAFHKKKYHDYFKAMEDIFKAHDGRPHWGKFHFREAQNLATTYPEFERFVRIREQQDPHNIFLSPYMAQIFG